MQLSPHALGRHWDFVHPRAGGIKLATSYFIANLPRVNSRTYRADLRASAASAFVANVLY